MSQGFGSLLNNVQDLKLRQHPLNAAARATLGTHIDLDGGVDPKNCPRALSPTVV